MLPISFQGSVLSLFLGPDGGPREGGIRLPPEKITNTTHLVLAKFGSEPRSEPEPDRTGRYLRFRFGC
jgi:hypothetical protein